MHNILLVFVESSCLLTVFIYWLMLFLDLFTIVVVKLGQVVLRNIFWQLHWLQSCCDLFQFANLTTRENVPVFNQWLTVRYPKPAIQFSQCLIKTWREKLTYENSTLLNVIFNLYRMCMVIHIQIHRELLDILLSVHTQFVFSTLLILDVNNDGFLDEQELEALFTKEVKKKKKKYRNFTCFKKCLQECLYFPQVHIGVLDYKLEYSGWKVWTLHVSTQL